MEAIALPGIIMSLGGSLTVFCLSVWAFALSCRREFQRALVAAALACQTLAFTALAVIAWRDGMKADPDPFLGNLAVISISVGLGLLVALAITQPRKTQIGGGGE